MDLGFRTRSVSGIDPPYYIDAIAHSNVYSLFQQLEVLLGTIPISEIQFHVPRQHVVKAVNAFDSSVSHSAPAKLDSFTTHSTS